MPRKDHITALTVAQKPARRRGCLSPGPTPTLPSLTYGASARDLEEGIGQSDRIDLLGQGRVHHENHRHGPRLPWREGLLGETEALELPEVALRKPRTVARHGLAGDGHVLTIGDLEGHLDELPRMDFDGVLQGPEAPGQIVGVGVELDDHLAA